jgi:hypothetical protein
MGLCGVRSRTGFPGRPVALTLDDLPGEDDVLKIEDREVVIFELVGSVG